MNFSLKPVFSWARSRSFILTVLLLSSAYTQAKDNVLDSLYTQLRTASEDSSKVKLLIDICWEYRIRGNMPEAMGTATQALKLAEDADYMPGVATAYNNISLVYADQANYPKAIEYSLKALETGKQLNDEKRLASFYNNLGVIYNIQADYTKALECYMEALKILEKLGDKDNAGSINNNIGIIYFNQSKYRQALEYYEKALKTRQENRDVYGTGSSYLNIGEVHLAQKHFAIALEYYTKCYHEYSSIDSRQGLATCSNSIGSLYAALTDEPDSIKQSFIRTRYSEGSHIPILTSIDEALLDSALQWRLRSLKLSRELGKKLTTTYSLNGLGDIMRKSRQYDQAITFYKMAAGLADSINAQESLLNASKGLYEAYQSMNRHDSALFWFREATRVRDSLFSAEKQVEFGRQEAQLAYDKEMAVVAEQRKQQQLITYSVAGGLGMMVIFSIVVVGRLKVTRKQKRTIEDQKALVDEKNKNILDSINYAKRIQDALLKDTGSNSLHLPPHFIFHQPKDIVSGDFYWSMEKQGHWYLAAVDCTGHGVPGALMSMLGMTFLNEINATDKLHTPGEILDHLRDKVVKELGQSGEEGGSKDGMDISLLRLDLSHRQVMWAGANNPLYVVQSLEHRAAGDKDIIDHASGIVLYEIAPDKQPVGFHPNHKSFTDHTLQLYPGDTLYMFTDGYADQFGGEKGKKFKYSRLKALLLSMQQEPIENQKNILATTFRNWQGSFEQIDDVCVIGVRV